MHPTTVAVDLAKNVFELAVADRHWHLIARHRFTRRQFERFLASQPPCHVVMEACGTAHHWGRVAQSHRHQVTLLPAQYVRPYARGNKTDRTDADALLEAVRSGRIVPVAIKTVAQQLLTIPGIGLLTATALLSTVGHINGFRRGRHVASWLGLTPREHSSGSRRSLGRITKRGDVYLRCLLTHGARAVLLAAQRVAAAGKPLTRLQPWAVAVAHRRGHNKATIALANKIARIVWAVWRYDVTFAADPALAA